MRSAALYLENGRHTNMRALAKNQARVLVFVSATCAGCVKFLKTMASWQERLPQVALHPVYSSLESLQTSRNAGTLPEGLTPLIDREAVRARILVMVCHWLWFWVLMV